MKVKQTINRKQLRRDWLSVLWGSVWNGEPGITHLKGTDKDRVGALQNVEVLEYRAKNGVLLGVVTVR